MTAVLALLRAIGPKGIAAGVLFALATGLIVTQGVRLGRAQDRLEQVQAEATTCRTQRDDLVARIEAQNRAIADLEAAGAAQAARAREAAQAAAQARADADARVRAILAAQIPSECHEAVRWGAVAGAELARRWSR